MDLEDNGTVELCRLVHSYMCINKLEGDYHLLCLIKGKDKYAFLYDDSSRAETLRVLGRFASHPELSFTWHEAAVLSQKIRQESSKQKEAKDNALKEGKKFKNRLEGFLN